MRARHLVWWGLVACGEGKLTLSPLDATDTDLVDTDRGGGGGAHGSSGDSSGTPGDTDALGDTDVSDDTDVPVGPVRVRLTVLPPANGPQPAARGEGTLVREYTLAQIWLGVSFPTTPEADLGTVRIGVPVELDLTRGVYEFVASGDFGKLPPCRNQPDTACDNGEPVAWWGNAWLYVSDDSPSVPPSHDPWLPEHGGPFDVTIQLRNEACVCDHGTP